MFALFKEIQHYCSLKRSAQFPTHVAG